MAAVLLNIDAGEYPDEPEELFALAHLVSIACGGHAGDAASMGRALERCARHGTLAGVHPSFPDRDGFGRKAMVIEPAALEASVGAQVEALARIAAERGIAISYIKPHGALYHAADRDFLLAEAVVQGALTGLRRPAGELTLLGPPGGAFCRCAQARGLRFAREGFADRGVRPDGTLVPRTEPGALISDPRLAAARVKELLVGASVETICVHADTPGSLPIARAVRDLIDAAAG